MKVRLYKYHLEVVDIVNNLFFLRNSEIDNDHITNLLMAEYDDDLSVSVSVIVIVIGGMHILTRFSVLLK